MIRFIERIKMHGIGLINIFRYQNLMKRYDADKGMSVLRMKRL